jgi:hypothetical protein
VTYNVGDKLIQDTPSWFISWLLNFKMIEMIEYQVKMISREIILVWELEFHVKLESSVILQYTIIAFIWWKNQSCQTEDGCFTLGK